MERNIANQWKVLTIASLTEFGERYGFYVIQALLVFLLINRFHITESHSDVLVGTVMSMLYIAAIVGGFIAERFLTYYRAALLGSFFMLGGNLLLALSHSENMLFVGLSFISVSTGLIKSNISSFIGRFYDQAELSHGHRDFGFNIFYVGINLGSFFALLFASYLKQHYGFAAPFYSSVIVAVLVLINLLVGLFLFRHFVREWRLDFEKFIYTAMILIGYLVLLFFILKVPDIANAAIWVAVATCCFILFKSAQGKYWYQVLMALIFFALSTLYWVLYMQEFISVLLFIDHSVDHQIFGLTLGNSQVLSVECVGILVFGALMGKLWLWLGQKGRPIHDIDKFNIGFILIAAMFLLFYLGIQLTGLHDKVPVGIIMVGFLIMAISELSLSAIGLSMITKIAPRGYVSLYMGIWLVTIGLGGKLAGVLSSYIHIGHNLVASKHNFSMGCLWFMALAALGVVVCLLVRRSMNKHVSQHEASLASRS